MRAWPLLLILAANDDKKPVEVVCPVDGSKFTALEVVHTNQWGGLDHDFCPHAFKTMPLEFFVWVCPSCGFAGRKKDFEQKLAPEVRQALLDGLKPAVPLKKGARQTEIPGHVKYDCLAQVARIRKLPPADVARAYLHAAWSCRQQGAVYFDEFVEWEAICKSYALDKPPLDLGRKNRTDYDLEIVRRVEQDIQAKRYERGPNRVLARYLSAFLYRKHGENAEAERGLKELESVKGENSVVDEAAVRMRESIVLERAYQKKALESYIAAVDAGGMDNRTKGEIAYEIGELYRRLGDPDSAVSWYKTAIDTSDSEALKKLAGDQLAKVEKKK